MHPHPKLCCIRKARIYTYTYPFAFHTWSTKESLLTINRVQRGNNELLAPTTPLRRSFSFNHTHDINVVSKYKFYPASQLLAFYLTFAHVWAKQQQSILISTISAWKWKHMKGLFNWHWKGQDNKRLNFRIIVSITDISCKAKTSSYSYCKCKQKLGTLLSMKLFLIILSTSVCLSRLIIKPNGIKLRRLNIVAMIANSAALWLALYARREECERKRNVANHALQSAWSPWRLLVLSKKGGINPNHRHTVDSSVVLPKCSLHLARIDSIFCKILLPMLGQFLTPYACFFAFYPCVF